MTKICILHTYTIKKNNKSDTVSFKYIFIILYININKVYAII